MTNERWLIARFWRAKWRVLKTRRRRRFGEKAGICLRFDPTCVSTAELIRRVTARYAVRDLFVENPPIEDIVARVYEEAEISDTVSRASQCALPRPAHSIVRPLPPELALNCSGG